MLHIWNKISLVAGGLSADFSYVRDVIWLFDIDDRRLLHVQNSFGEVELNVVAIRVHIL